MGFWDCSLLEWSIVVVVIGFTAGIFWYVITPESKKEKQH